MTVSESDAEPPAAPGDPGRGGPSWLHGSRPAGDTEAPSVVSTAPPTLYPGLSGSHGPTPGSAEELFTARYNRNGVTPIPFMVVALVAVGAAWWAVGWAERVPGAPEPVRSSQWWINVTAVLLPSEDLGPGAYSVTRMWTAIGLLVLAALLVALWIGRIGGNVRTGQGPFGVGLALAALPAWWMLPITLGVGEGRSRSDMLIRFLVAFALIFAQFLLLRWPLLNRIWRAGRMPYDMASIVLWLPMFVPWLLLFASSAFTLFTVDQGERLSTSSWAPTSTMEDWATWTTRASALGIGLLLVVVSVRQHLGMAKDRADDLAARAR